MPGVLRRGAGRARLLTADGFRQGDRLRAGRQARVLDLRRRRHGTKPGNPSRLSRPPTKARSVPSTTPRWGWVPSRCMPRGCGRNITPVTSVRSCATPTATTSKRSVTARPPARSVAGMSGTDAAAHELLRDSFTRLIEHVDELTDGLTAEMSGYQPTPSANSIAWLIWHSARVQDIQLAHVAGVEEVWTRDGWVDRFGLDLPRRDTRYGDGAAEVGKVNG